MKYIFNKYTYQNRETEYWIELNAEMYSIRQINIGFPYGLVISCLEFGLAEDQIILEDMLGEVIELTKEQFDKKWYELLLPYRDMWEEIKNRYTINSIFIGQVNYFYPQGTIIKSDEAIAVAKEVESSFAFEQVQGKVVGYDEQNMWLIVEGLKLKK